jgi:hypothetical protein
MSSSDCGSESECGSEKDSSSNSPNAIALSVTDHLVGRRAALSLGTDHNPLTPQELRAHIERPLKLVEAAVWFGSQRSQGKRRREEPPLPFGYMRAEYSAATRVRFMFGCVTAACQRLSTSPGTMFVPARKARRWAELTMERMTRGYVRRVEVWSSGARAVVLTVLARVTTSYVARDHTARVFDPRCSKHWLTCRCCARPHRRRQACHRTPSRSRLGAGCRSCHHRWSARFILGCGTR